MTWQLRWQITVFADVMSHLGRECPLHTARDGLGNRNGMNGRPKGWKGREGLPVARAKLSSSSVRAFVDHVDHVV